MPRHSKVKAAAPFKAPFKKEKSENKKNSVGFLHLLRPDDARSNAVYPAANRFCLLSALVYHIAAGLSTVCAKSFSCKKCKGIFFQYRYTRERLSGPPCVERLSYRKEDGSRPSSSSSGFHIEKRAAPSRPRRRTAFLSKKQKRAAAKPSSRFVVYL